MKPLRYISILLLVLFCLSSCSGGSGAGTQPSPDESSVDPADTPSESSSSIDLNLDAESAIVIANEDLAELQANGHFLTYVFHDVHYSETDNTWVVAYRIEPLVPGGGLYYAISKRTGEIVKRWGSE